MKNETNIIIVLLLLTLVVSCVKDHADETGQINSIDGNTIFVPSEEGEEVRVSIVTSGDWSVSNNNDWVAIYPSSGIAGENILTVKTSMRNSNVEEKVGSFELVVEGEPETYFIVQRGVPGVDIQSPIIVVDGIDGGRRKVSLRTNTELSVEIGSPWALLKGVHYAQDSTLLPDGVNYSALKTAVLDVEVLPFEGTEMRSTVITVKYGQDSALIDLIHSSIEWEREFYKKSLALKFTGQSCAWCPFMSDAMYEVQNEVPERMEIMNLYGYYEKDELYYEEAQIFDEFFAKEFRAGAPYMVLDYNVGIESHGEDVSGLKSKIITLLEENRDLYPAKSALYVQSDFDGRALEVAGFVAVKEMLDYKLNIFVMENGITAHQAGRGDGYVHNDVVRYSVTEVLGEPLSKYGEYVDCGQGYIMSFYEAVELPEWVFRDGRSDKCHILMYLSYPGDDIEDGSVSGVEYINLGMLVDNVVTVPLNEKILTGYEK